MGGGRQDGDPSLPPPPPSKWWVHPQNRRIWVKGAFSQVTVSPKVAEGPDVASHVTSADYEYSAYIVNSPLHKLWGRRNSLSVGVTSAQRQHLRGD